MRKSTGALIGLFAVLGSAAYVLTRKPRQSSADETALLKGPSGEVQLVTPAVKYLEPVQFATLDTGLTLAEIDAVSFALSREEDPVKLISFASTFEPSFPIAASLLYTKSQATGRLREAVSNAMRVPLPTEARVHPSLVTAINVTTREVEKKLGPQEAMKLALARPVVGFLGDMGDAARALGLDVEKAASDLFDFHQMLVRASADPARNMQEAQKKIADAANSILKHVKDVGQAMADIGKVVGPILKIVAPVVGLIPGIGTGVAMMMAAAGSLACGEPLSDAVMHAISNAMPGGPIVQMAVQTALDAGKSIAEGKSLGEAALSAARSAAISAGGPLAGVAFDATLAVARGESLQQAGFKVLAGWVKGNDLAERAVQFSQKIAFAAQRGKSVKDFLIDEGIGELKRYAGSQLADLTSRFDEAINRFVKDASLLGVSYEDLAREWKMHESVVRGALMCVKTAGNSVVVDVAIRKRFESGLNIGRLIIDGTERSRVIAAMGVFIMPVSTDASSLASQQGHAAQAHLAQQYGATTTLDSHLRSGVVEALRPALEKEAQRVAQMPPPPSADVLTAAMRLQWVNHYLAEKAAAFAAA